MKVNWYETGLSGIIRSRGESYYRHNQVRLESTRVTKNGFFLFTARVLGSDDYHVEVEMTETGSVRRMACTCPYASGGNDCKHMAALLYYVRDWNPPRDLFQQMIEKRNQAAQRRREERERQLLAAEAAERRKEAAYFASRTPVHPFAPPAPDTYRYFDFSLLTAPYVIYDLDLEEAERLMGRGSPSIRYAYAGELQSEDLVCVLEDYSCAGIVLQRDRILRAGCHIPGCRCRGTGLYPTPENKKALCPGVLSGLLLMRDWIESNPDHGDATSYYARRLLEDFSRRIHREKNAPAVGAREVALLPFLRREEGRLFLAWKIGADKMYAVKSLNSLVDIVEGKGTLALGKNTAFHFDLDHFDEASQRWYDMIREAVVENRNTLVRPRTHWYGELASIPELKTTLPLFGARLDQFFDNAPRTGLTYTDTDGEGNQVYRLRFAADSVLPVLTLRQIIDEHGVFHGVRMFGSLPELLPGARFRYQLTTEDGEATLTRVSPEAAEHLKPLSRMTVDGKLDMSIGRERLAEFYYTVLPELKKLADVQEPDAAAIAACLPPPAEFAVYLDAENRVPVARVAVTYGETVCSLLDWRKPGFVRQSFRSPSLEARASGLMDRYFAVADPERDQYRCEDSETAVLCLLDQGLEELTAFCAVHSTPAFDALRIRRLPQVQVGVSLSDGSLLDLHITSGDLSPQELLEILDSYRRKKTYHRLRGGSWIRLDEDVSELSLLLDGLGISPKDFVSGKMHIPAYRALYLDRMLEQSEHFYATRDQRFRKLIKEFKTVSDSDFEVPAALEKVMRSYQIYGYKWLRTLAEYGFGGILADDMGLGKTLQMIAVLLAAREAGVPGPSLVVCPASLVYNWQEECARFAPELRTATVAGTKAERAALLKQSGQYDLLITSYDLLKRDILLYEDVEFLYQVIDEAQFIKTQTTAAAKSVRLVRAKHRFALTGTPIENRLSELWSIFDFLMPGYLYNYETFKRQFETPIARQQDADVSARLQKMIRPFVLRRLKSDVLKDLPDKLEEVRYVRLEGEQKRLYDGQAVKIRAMLEKSSEEEVSRGKIQILAQLTRIRQICCDPSLLFEAYDASSAKREACLDLIRSAMDGGHRILLFSQFTSMLSLLEKDLTDAGIEWYTITGATPKQERVELVRRFNEGTVPVFLISLKAGGTGLNLTGADTVIHYDPWWNVAAQNQATDRAHRIGQTRTVCVYKLIGKDTIEEKILKLQQDKQDLAEEILSGEGPGISAMTREELLALLE